MIKIKQAVIVEGKYDKIKLSTVLDTVIIQTDGFGIFKDKEKQRLIKRLAQTRGIVILTDSDSAGFKIRSFIGGSVPKNSVIHAYIPDVFGKSAERTRPRRRANWESRVLIRKLCSKRSAEPESPAKNSGKEPHRHRGGSLRSGAQRKSGLGGSAQKISAQLVASRTSFDGCSRRYDKYFHDIR